MRGLCHNCFKSGTELEIFEGQILCHDCFKMVSDRKNNNKSNNDDDDASNAKN